MPDSAQSGTVERAPWTSAQCNRIWEFQQRQDTHPLTCEYHSHTPLAVSLRGLYCGMPTCSYRQDWVHPSIAGPR